MEMKGVISLKRAFAIAAFFLMCLSVQAQRTTVTANLTAQSTACATPSSCLVVAVDQNEGGKGFTLAGTWSGTVQFEASADGAQTWQSINATPSNSTTAVTSATGNGVWQANVAGFTHVRIRVSTYSSGTVVASINGSSASARASGGGAGTLIVSSNPSTCTPGQTFYNTTTGQFLTCTATNTLSINTNSVYTLNVTDPQYAVGGVSISAAGGGKMCSDVTISGSPLRTVTSAANCTFTPADVTKEAMNFQSCDTDSGAGQIDNVPAGTTIAAFVSAHVVTLSATATSALSASCFQYGTNYDAQMTLVDTAMTNSPVCPVVQLPNFFIVVDLPHLTQGVAPQEPASCAVLPQVHGGSVNGGGMVVRGYGGGVSGFWLGNTFMSNIATHSGNGQSHTASWFLQGSNEWHDFSILGGGEHCASQTPGNFHLLEVYGYAVLENMHLANFCQQSQSGNDILFNGAGLPIAIVNSDLDGFGSGIQNPGSLVEQTNTTIQDYCGVANTYMIQVGANGGSSVPSWDISGGFNDIIPGACTAAGTSLITVWSNLTGAGQLFMGIANGDTLKVIGINLGGSAIVQLSNAYFNGITGASTSIGIQNATGAGVVKLANSQVVNWPTAANFYVASSGTFWDGCNNNINGNFMTLSGTAQVFGNECSVTGTSPTTGSFVRSANWGTSNTATAILGGNAPVQFTLTNGTASTGASPTIAYTFPQPYYVAPQSCSAVQTGGTNATGTFTSSALSKTGVTFTFSLTPTANSTEIISITCVVQ